MGDRFGARGRWAAPGAKAGPPYRPVRRSARLLGVPAALRSLPRRAAILAVGFAALILGFLAFTALGIGGGDDAGSPPPAAAADPDAFVIDPAKVRSGPTAVQRSESIGLRENGGAGDPNAPELSERVPFTDEDYAAPIAAYRRYAAGHARRLVPEGAALAASIEAGDRAKAKAAWRALFDRYLRLGAVYGAFGALDDRIAGSPGGLPRGEQDPDFVGLHRIERGLWNGEPVRSLAPAAARLERDLAGVERAAKTAEITPLDYALRAHEILEGAQVDFLTGNSVPWSREGVLATASSLEATAAVIGTLHPLLKGQQADGLTQVGISRLRATLRSLRASHSGRLPTLDGLSRRERQQLIGSTGWLLEQLQSVPPAIETRDPEPVPAITTP